jgi:UDP-glucose 4-epimerase
MKDKNILISGGAGFIGSNLAEKLAQDNTVVIVDDFSTGNRRNLSGLGKMPNVTCVESSILNLDVLTDVCKGVDFVFHEAAIPSVPRSIANPLASNQANITGTLNMLLAARDNRVKKVVFASSSSVYGDTPVLPKVETMGPNPMSPYALTKLAGEHYCHLFSQLYGLPTIALRYFNVYGPRQDPASQYSAVISKFIAMVDRGEAPTIFGDGTQKRDFTYVSDVVQANILAAESDATGVANVGTGITTSVNEVAQLIIKSIGSGSLSPLHLPPRKGDVKDSLADISKARAFGYSPRFSLAEGLAETIRAYRSRTIG